ncbi:NADPH:quinone oxidoreductase family protein [Sciscionella marina]|uniref:NADPH:quinone oxidoreductase family protein n=1 Tax=Sciscionella marina TaxID=508770 RepID=UPI0003777096|nr:NADPH:quinone oxidoreductase family protein [Sciscionella marina]
MRAVRITSLDGPEAIEVSDVPEPELPEGHVLIDVYAAGVAFPDLLQTRGRYQMRPELPFTPGMEVAGVVRSAPGGSGFVAGDRVAAMAWLGGFAEVAVAPPQMVAPLPEGMSFIEGAGVLVNMLTAHFALTKRGRYRGGETVLVQGAAGGVGVASIQLARALGAEVIAVVSSAQKAVFARRAGASMVLPVEGFKDAVREHTGGRGVDLVVDPVGGDRFADSRRCLAPEGRLLVIGFAGGRIPTIEVNRLLLNNIEVVGAAWGEYLLRHPAYLREQWDELTPLLADGELAPLLGGVYPLDRAAEALSCMDNRAALGKLVLETG